MLPQQGDIVISGILVGMGQIDQGLFLEIALARARNVVDLGVDYDLDDKAGLRRSRLEPYS